MHTLLLTQIVPYPPDSGPKIKTWHVIRYLAGHGHKVTLVSFARQDEEKYVNKLREVCSEVYTITMRRSRLADIFYWLYSHITGRPFLIERDNIPAMHSLVERLLAEKEIDIIHADQLTMGQFALGPSWLVSKQRALSRNGNHPKNIQLNHDILVTREPTLIFDAHNAVWTILERMRQTAAWYLKPIIALEASRVKRYEGEIIRKFDFTLTVTETDQRALYEAMNFAHKGKTSTVSSIKVIPITVDTEKLVPIHRKHGSRNILTIGTLHYPPNADGIRWFLREVFPLVCQNIPEVTVTVVGKNPPQDLVRLAQQSSGSISFTGYVADLTYLLEQAALMVVPVRAGGGMRVRILEGFARAMPMVTTTMGLEGIQAHPDEDILVQDTPSEFAESVIKLLRDEFIQSKLATNGRHLAEQFYDWKIALKELDAIYPVIEKQGSELEAKVDESH